MQNKTPKGNLITDMPICEIQLKPSEHVQVKLSTTKKTKTKKDSTVSPLKHSFIFTDQHQVMGGRIHETWGNFCLRMLLLNQI